jgi:hypothetical protein
LRPSRGPARRTTCLGVWAWEHAIEKRDYISCRGEWELEGVPMNVIGKLR